METKLEELCKPVVAFLKENYDPYTKIVVSDSHVKVISDLISIVNK